MPSIELELSRNPASARSARQHLASFLGDLGRADLLPDGALIVTELVTNAVLHGREPIRLSVELDALLRIRVFDAGRETGPVAVCAIDPSLPGGRGLRIVSTLADSWGVTAHPEGKTAWAHVTATIPSTASGLATSDHLRVTERTPDRFHASGDA